MRAFAPLSLAVLLAVSASTGAIAAERDYVPVQQRFSAEQMQATGLSGLSAEQLSLLNELLSQDQTKAVAEAKRKVIAERNDPFSKVAADPVQSTVKGEFRGFSGGSVIALENGQRWQVIAGDLFIGKPVNSPKVTIKPGMMGAWYLEVEGQIPKAKVRRIDEG